MYIIHRKLPATGKMLDKIKVTKCYIITTWTNQGKGISLIDRRVGEPPNLGDGSCAGGSKGGGAEAVCRGECLNDHEGTKAADPLMDCSSRGCRAQARQGGGPARR